ncbi:hypothetical protein [Pseudonocardia sp. WMMC193]|uniref:hypothetical protein n=1 Tax=Pseudonocardia sp. WMMC193 TaxID=2911965 RepID=UPI001F40B1A9|nr:hypothetical protein [Pseudonocardia sp. WMMC193]MCF7552307.1 hypothetical protein [Pseudonocardia sp. WMMC193]
MVGHRVLVYYAWNRPAEAGAPHAVIEDRFPALFESRRMLFPQWQELADPERVDQGIGGFLDHVLTPNFAAFVAEAAQSTGVPVPEVERVDGGGVSTALDQDLLGAADTVVVVSFDSLRTRQSATRAELLAVRSFLATPGNLLVVSPHHDIGDGGDSAPVDGAGDPLRRDREAEFRHHGDATIPPRQGFGGFARSLLAGLGVPVRNRFGLRPAAAPDGTPAPILPVPEVDRAGLLRGVSTFNLHRHLPHLERSGEAVARLDVLARQRIDASAAPHEFCRGGRTTFDAMLQSRPGVFAGDLLVTDATLWSSTAGGVDSLRRLWRNVLDRQLRHPLGADSGEGAP